MRAAPVKLREVKSWTRLHDSCNGRGGFECHQCGERITFGGYIRRVFVRIGDRRNAFEIYREHAEPVCQA